MEMYGRELSNNQLNEIFYNESSETKEIENNYLPITKSGKRTV